MFIARKSKQTVLCLVGLILAAAFLAACAGKSPSRMSRVLPQVTTMAEAKRHFGHPAASLAQADGSTRHEWLLDAHYKEQGKWVRELSPWVRYDSDGYRVEQYRDVWKPARTVSKYCRLTITADADGKVLNSRWEGDSCDDIIISGEQ